MTFFKGKTKYPQNQFVLKSTKEKKCVKPMSNKEFPTIFELGEAQRV